MKWISLLGEPLATWRGNCFVVYRPIPIDSSCLRVLFVSKEIGFVGLVVVIVVVVVVVVVVDAVASSPSVSIRRSGF